jgi:hypothetical protein
MPDPATAHPDSLKVLQTVHDTIRMFIDAPVTGGATSPDLTVLLWLPNVALVMVTLYYAIQTRQTVREMQRARTAQVMPRLVPGFAPAGPLVMYPRVVNVGPGAATDIDCTMRLESGGPEWRWRWALLVSGEDQEFLPRWKCPDGTDFQPYISQFEKHFSQLTLMASYYDVTGTRHVATGRAEIAETLRLFHSVGVHTKTTPVEKLKRQLEALKTELTAIRRSLDSLTDHGHRLVAAVEAGMHMSPWDVQSEFIPLLQNHQLTHAQVHTNVLPGRQPGAIETVREAVCDWHGAGNFAATALNQACRAHLAQPGRPRYTCWKCGHQF